MEMRKILLCLAVAVASSAWAEAPKGYYATCEGYNGATLLKKLEGVIGDHTQVGYSGLWELYGTTDVYDDGKIWDMYSTKHWKYQDEQCGNYSAVGDCYNREHSMPKSWFNDELPMYCDAFHIYPTDGKVNGQRSNYPYGECANGTTLPASGNVKALGKLGASTFPGYSGTVFEPDDEYKGDFARSYFYMAACYNGKIKYWNSEMLAGNSYPAFTSWAVDLLLKWHRQDPVSQKELDRNEAVYAEQHNRNPFIDYPDMVEYIWGDKQDKEWSSSEESEATLVLPVDGATYDFGYLNIYGEETVTVTVKGTNLTSPVTLSTDVFGISADKTSIPAAEANRPDGAKVQVIWNPEDVGEMRGTITFASGSLKSVVNITGYAVDRLSANPARDISDRSFTASWTYVGDELDNGAYTICVKPADGSESEMTMEAPAIDRQCIVEWLEPSTEYIYWVESKTMKSNEVPFTTGEPIPSIQLLYDGELLLTAAPGEPSEAYELLVDAEYIFDPIVVTVKEPFAISTDKAEWGTTLTLAPDEERFYMRIYSDAVGNYTTGILLVAGDYVNDGIVVQGIVAESQGLFEDFEADATGCETYAGCQYKGTAATWQLDNAGIWASDSQYALSGVQCVRMGKNANSTITMLDTKKRGIGDVVVHARRWSSKEGDCTFHVEYTTDDGATWQSTTDAVVNSDDYQEFTFAVNVSDDARIRIAQTAGARFVIDDVEITEGESGIADAERDYHSWDAFCRKGQLVIESAEAQEAVMFGMDGIIRFRGTVCGTASFELEPGLYVVAINGFSRTVMVK